MEKNHPNKEWFITTTIWKDGDFRIKICHSECNSTFPITHYIYEKSFNNKYYTFRKRILNACISIEQYDETMIEEIKIYI